MKFEVTRKGMYRRKRVVLGYVEADKKPDVEAALTALGWRYFDTRLTGKLYANVDDFLLSEQEISIKKVNLGKKPKG